MTAQKDPYVRVYYAIKADPKFVGIYRDDRALGCWLRLLITADASHPAPAEFPMGTDMETVQRLVDAGLVDLIGDGCYTIHGLENERTKRSSDARTAAKARWSDAPAMRPHTDRNAAASTSDATAMRPHATAMRPHADNTIDSMPLRSSPLHSAPLHSAPNARAPETDRYGLPHLEGEVVRIAEEVSGRSITTLHGHWAGELDRLVEERGGEAVGGALRASAAASGPKPSWPQIVAGVRNILEPLPSSSKTKAAPVDEGEEFLRKFREGKVKL